jgi:glucose-1-phosphate cytidylyltransferase
VHGWDDTYPAAVRALILCGGRGTRAWPSTAELPKPMLEIGGVPVLRHVMDIYAHQGVREFVLAAGYRHEVIAEYAGSLPEWDVTVLDTGDDADTGERVLACLDHVSEEFFLTYGDGLADVDLGALLTRHHEHPGSATVTVVPLPSQYGTVVVSDDGRVVDFREKPVLPDHLINAGFFVVDRSAFATPAGPSLERDILPDLGRRGELFVYRHGGFWRSMDTHKDVAELNALAAREGTPWRSTTGSAAAASSSPAPRASSART